MNVHTDDRKLRAVRASLHAGSFTSETVLWRGTTPDPTRGNRGSQFHELTGELTSKVCSNYRSRSQRLQLSNPTVRRRI